MDIEEDWGEIIIEALPYIPLVKIRKLGKHNCYKNISKIC